MLVACDRGRSTREVAMRFDVSEWWVRRIKAGALGTQQDCAIAREGGCPKGQRALASVPHRSLEDDDVPCSSSHNGPDCPLGCECRHQRSCSSTGCNTAWCRLWNLRDCGSVGSQNRRHSRSDYGRRGRGSLICHRTAPTLARLNSSSRSSSDF